MWAMLDTSTSGFTWPFWHCLCLVRTPVPQDKEQSVKGPHGPHPAQIWVLQVISSYLFPGQE